MTRREREIIDLWEEGLPRAEIAAALGLSERYVKNVIQSLGAPGNNTHFDRMVAAGSAALLAAIKVHHPERVSR